MPDGNSSEHYCNDAIYSALRIYGISPPRSLQDKKINAELVGFFPLFGALILAAITLGLWSRYDNHGGLYLSLFPAPVLIFIAVLPYLVFRGARRYFKMAKKEQTAMLAWLSETVSDKDLAKLLSIKLSGPRTYSLMESFLLDGDEITYQKLLDQSDAVCEAMREDRHAEESTVNDHSDEIKSILGLKKV